jgi:hypothetical protein
MTKFKSRKNMLFAGIVFGIGLYLLASTGCKNTTSPEDSTSGIIVTVKNECGVAVDIYLNKNFQFAVEYLDSNTINNVSLGLHEFEAKKKGTEILLSYLKVEIFEKLNYTLTIESEASFHITNKYGETLSIYGDGELLSDIGSQGTLIIENVLYGEHLFRATISDGTEVASIRLDFDENKPYLWTISK